MTALSLTGRALWIDFRGVPASWDRFYAAARAAGVRGAIRYIDAGSDGKQVHAAERQAAARNGIELLLVDELGTGDAWDDANDRAAGIARGKASLADARTEGFGPVGIAAAADAHATTRQVADAVEYARGFASVVGRPWSGFYGFREVLTAVRAANLVAWHWLCGSVPSAEDARWIAFWQDNRAGALMVIDGVECDKNWRLDGPIPGAATNIEEDDMPTPAENWAYKGKGDSSDMRQQLVDARTAAQKSQAIATQSQVEQRQLAATVSAALAADKDVTAEQMTQIVAEQMEAHKPNLAELATILAPDLGELVHAAVAEALGDDNTDQADAIVTALTERLQNGATA